jgi:hypothetical protein
MVCSHSLAGVAPGEAPKAEATELAPEAVGASPPVATRYLRAYRSGSPGGLSCRDAFCFW